MEFEDKYFNKEHRFSVGIEKTSDSYYLSIPVSNSLCDYEEYYLIDNTLFENYPSNLEDLVVFASSCRAKRNDHLLFMMPGQDRGMAS